MHLAAVAGQELRHVRSNSSTSAGCFTASSSWPTVMIGLEETIAFTRDARACDDDNVVIVLGCRGAVSGIGWRDHGRDAASKPKQG